MASDSRGLRHQTEASEAGSREPVGISRTTGVTKTCRATGAVKGSEIWLPWKMEIIMYVASIHASISTSGLHPDLPWLRVAPHDRRACIGRLPTQLTVAKPASCERTLGDNRGDNCERKPGQLRATQIA